MPRYELPEPTRDLLAKTWQEFDTNNDPTERALTEVMAKFPRNTDEAHVLLKVAAVNQLYSTQIYAVREVAKRIVGLKIDPLLDSGSLEFVDQIAELTLGEKVRHNLSFASKYCSWHRRDVYPIYDSYVEERLWAYRRQFGLTFVRADLWRYTSFVAAISEFRDRFGLGDLSFKEIDKFLWQQGGALIEWRQANKSGRSLLLLTRPDPRSRLGLSLIHI